MLQQAAILLAAIAITACGETAPLAEEKQTAALIKATNAAIIIQSYEVETNQVTPAKISTGAGGQDR
ncbi:MAG: hypothetical protein ACI910_001102 [Oleispira sp.]|jgi:hypothetical protein